MNKIDQNRPFYLESGSHDIHYVLNGDRLMVSSKLFIGDEPIQDCAVGICLCQSEDCILRNETHQDEIRYLDEETGSEHSDAQQRA